MAYGDAGMVALINFFWACLAWGVATLGIAAFFSFFAGRGNFGRAMLRIMALFGVFAVVSLIFNRQFDWAEFTGIIFVMPALLFGLFAAFVGLGLLIAKRQNWPQS
jgi:hypothetical protein